MKSNELRLGNLVIATLTNEIYEIGIWALRVIEDGNYQNSYDTETKVYEPIPLTEEWLERLGFKLCGYELLSWEHETLLEGFQLTGINWADADEPNYQFLNYNIGDNIFSIHYVHQLQNLYFALTGEELKLKEDESKID